MQNQGDERGTPGQPSGAGNRAWAIAAAVALGGGLALLGFSGCSSSSPPSPDPTPPKTTTSSGSQAKPPTQPEPPSTMPPPPT